MEGVAVGHALFYLVAFQVLAVSPGGDAAAGTYKTRSFTYSFFWLNVFIPRKELPPAGHFFSHQKVTKRLGKFKAQLQAAPATLQICRACPPYDYTYLTEWKSALHFNTDLHSR